MTPWRTQRPARWYWSDDEPGDPDFQLEFALSPGDRVRLRGRWPMLLAQRLFRKPPHLIIAPAEGYWRLRVTVGLSELYAVVGRRLDPLLARLFWIEVRGGNPWDDRIRLDAHVPLNITLPNHPRAPGDRVLDRYPEGGPPGSLH